MRRRARVLRVLWRWQAGLSVLLLATLLESGFVGVHYRSGTRLLEFSKGRVLAGNMFVPEINGWRVYRHPLRFDLALWVWTEHSPDWHWWKADIPLWPALLALSGGAVLCWRLDLRRQRRGLGRCAQCGYDRRGLDMG